MIDKNICKDILPFKKYLYLILASDAVQAVLMAGASYTTAYLADRLLKAQLSVDTAAPFTVLLFFFLAVKAVLAHYSRVRIEQISQQVQSRLRAMLLKALVHREQIGKDMVQGQWLALITRGVDKLDAYISSFLPQLGMLAVFPIVLLVCAFANDWISGLIFLFTAPLIPLFMILIGKMADKENKRQWQTFMKLTSYMADLLPGLLVLKAYNQAQRQLQQIAANGEQFSRATLKVLRIAFLSAFMLEFISTLSIAVIAVNIGLRLIYGEAQFLPVFFMLLIAPQFYQPFRQFGAAFHEAMNGITASSEIYSLQKQLNQTECEHGNAPAAEIKMTAPPRIVFDDVHYTYENGSGLNGLSFTAEGGEQTVIAGVNGAGKSTAFKLLLNLLKPKAGRITIDGIELKNIDEAVWRRSVGWAAQEPYVFSASFKDNIAMGRKCSMEDIMLAAEQANLDEFISSLPQGYNSIIGGSIKLSSGQKRRLGLARALLCRPKLLLLDEPLENLDRQNEELISSILDGLRGKVTVLIIAHRLHTIERADKIIMMENGRLLEEGSPAELTEKNGAYAALTAAAQKRNGEGAR